MSSSFPHPSVDELTNADFLPLTILRQNLVPTLLSPPRFYYHPSTHNKRNSELVIQNKDKVGGSDANILINSKRSYPADDKLINSDTLPLTMLK